LGVLTPKNPQRRTRDRHFPAKTKKWNNFKTVGDRRKVTIEH